MFPLDENVKELQRFYIETNKIYPQIKGSIVNSLAVFDFADDIVQMVGRDPNMNEKEERNAKYLPKGVIILMCALWEEFRKYLEVNDNAKYQLKFTAGYKKYYNNEVTEIFLVRNCLVHRNGKIDSVEDSQLIGLGNKYQAGNLISLSEQEINIFFGEVLKAFSEI